MAYWLLASAILIFFLVEVSSNLGCVFSILYYGWKKTFLAIASLIKECPSVIVCLNYGTCGKYDLRCKCYKSLEFSRKEFLKALIYYYLLIIALSNAVIE